MDKLGWWHSADGGFIFRRDQCGQVRRFELGVDGIGALEGWVSDHLRVRDLAQCGRIRQSHHRAEQPALAQSEDLAPSH